MLRDTKLAISCDPQMLFQIQRLGELIKLPAEHLLFQTGDEADYMYVVVEGDIFVKGGPQEFVIGAGDFLGEIGFFAGTGRTRNCEVGPNGAQVWRIKRDLLYDDLDTETTILLSNFLLALAPHIHIRLLTISGREEDGVCYKCANEMINVSYDCDHTHRSIMALESHLRGKDPWSTAENVWQFVSHLPFRFGHWHTRASQTLEVGFGTTTSKANLQVALFRALGMEAGYARIKVPGGFYDALKPPGLRKHHANAVALDHDFCAVKLDDRWVPCDGSFTKEALQLLAEMKPEFRELIWERFQPSHGFSMIPILQGDPQFDVSETLDSYMLNVDPGNLEAMNISLDKVQGAMYPQPMWINAAQSLLAHNPRIAYMKVFANILADINRFLQHINKGGPDEEQTLIF